MSAEWSEYCLSEVIQIIGGGTPKRSNLNYWNGNIPWLSVVDFNNDAKIVESTVESITQAGLENSSTKLLKTGDIIISARGTVGCLAQLSRPMAFNQSCYGLRAKSNFLTNDYLYYLLRIKVAEFKRYAHGAVFDTITRATFDNIMVRLPSLEVQQKIVSILDAIDQKIALNQKINQTLEQMAQAIFKSWFVDFDPVKAKMNGEQPEGMDSATASLFPDKLVESELGLIPEGWTVKPFKKVIDKYVDNRGKTPPVVEDGIPLVEVKHLPENSAFPNLNTDKRVTEETFNTWFRVHVEPKDVLISTVGTIGRTSFVKNTNFGIAQNVLGLRFGKVVEPEYMFYTIKAHRFQHDMDARLVTTVQSSIKRKDLDTIDILVPPSNVQKEFCKLVGSLLDGQYSKNAENIELASLRDLLLPKLLSGEIELRQAQELAEVE